MRLWDHLRDDEDERAAAEYLDAALRMARQAR